MGAISGSTMAVMGVMAAMSAAAAYSADQQQRGQIDIANKQVENDNKATLAKMQQDYTALNDEQRAAAAEAVDQSMQNQQAASEAQGRVNTLAAAQGMGGTSVDDLLFQVQKEKGENMSNILNNQEVKFRQIKDQSAMAHLAAKSGMKVQLNKPSGMASGLNITTSAVGGAMQGYQMGKSIDKAMPANAGAANATGGKK